MTLMYQKVKQYKNDAAGLTAILPDVAESYDRFTAQCFEAGELDAKTKQLIALGVALFANNEICTYYHVQAARALGATDIQIMETAAVASGAASGHVISQGVTRVQTALKMAIEEKEQDTEFADESPSDGMSVPGGDAVSPSY